MNINYDYQIFSAQKYGGVSRYFHELCKNIDSKRNNVNVIAPLYINNYINNKHSFSLNGLKIPKIKYTGRVVNYLNYFATNSIIRHDASLDIFHETWYTNKPIQTVSAKRVITIHDMIHEKYPESFSKHDNTRERKKSAVDRADHIICVSRNTKNDLITLLNVDPEKISVVYHGISDLKNSINNECGVINAPYILYVGNRGGYKNFNGLLKAYSNSTVMKEEFILVCFGGGSFSKAEVEQINSLSNVNNRVINVSGDDDYLTLLYEFATLFVYPSIYEGFGMPLLEAMAAGCPVACSNTSSLPEVAGDAAEFFDPYNCEEMIEAIEKAALSNRNALIGKGYQNIKRFSWSKCAEQTILSYKNIL